MAGVEFVEAVDPEQLHREATGSHLSSVTVDNVAGGRLAIDHLAALGHRRIGFVGGPTSLAQVADRLTGAQDAAAGADRPLVHLDTSGLTIDEGRDAARRLLEISARRRPTAAFAANDLLAIGLLQGLRAAGARVPDDVAIIGYDDIDYAASTEVPLTSIRQPSRLIGATAVELLLERIDDPTRSPDRRQFQPELIVRQSTAPTA